MALANADRVKETTTTTGTGTLTLGGAVTGFQTFAAIGNANTCYCCCYAVDANGLPTGQWEVFLGTYTASGTTLARTTLIASSTGSAIDFSAGTKHVVVCLPSQGTLIVRQVGGTAGTNEVQIDGTNGIYAGNPTIRGKNTKLLFENNGSIQFWLADSSCGPWVSFQDPNSQSFQLTTTGDFNVRSTAIIGWNSGASIGAPDTAFARNAAGVVEVNNGSAGTLRDLAARWIRNNGGLSRVDSAVTNATVTPANITGLSATLIAGRKYTGKLVVFASCPTAADGILIDFDGGAATMTSFQAAVTSNVQGATLGVTISSALATDLTATALNGTAVNCIVIEFGLVCNAAGTFIPRVAKNADAGGATLTIAANSFMELQDAP